MIGKKSHFPYSCCWWKCSKCNFTRRHSWRCNRVCDNSTIADKHTDSNSNGNIYADADSDSDADADVYFDEHSDGYSDECAERHIDCGIDADRQSDAAYFVCV